MKGTLLPGYKVVDQRILVKQTNKTIPDVRLGSLAFGIRARRAIHTINPKPEFMLSELIGISQQELLDIRQVGKGTIEDIKAVISLYVEKCIREGRTVDRSKTSNRFNSVLVEGYNVDGNTISNVLGFRVKNIPVPKMALSVRATNALLRNKIHDLAELLMVDEDTLLSFRNLGKKTQQEILNYVDAYLDDMTNFNNPVDTDNLSSDTKKVLNYIDLKPIDQSVLASTFDYEWHDIDQIAQEAGNPDPAVFEKVIEHLTASGVIRLVNKKCRRTYPRFVDLLSSAEPNNSGLSQTRLDVLRERAEGMTLEEIACLHNVTRERIRQIEAVAFRKLTIRNKKPFEEAKFLPLYERYIIPASFFTSIENGGALLLFLRHTAERKGSRPFKESLYDNSLPTDVSRAVGEYVDKYKPHLRAKGRWLKDTKESNLTALFLSDRNRIWTFTEAMDEYNRMVCKKGLPELQITSAHCMSARLSPSKSCIKTGSHAFRGYSVGSVDVKTLLEKIHPERYKGEISARVIYNDNQKELAELDIRNGYELHSLLKKLNADRVVSGMQFLRIPMIYFEEVVK